MVLGEDFAAREGVRGVDRAVGEWLERGVDSGEEREGGRGVEVT